jgi:hypothetical protein
VENAVGLAGVHVLVMSCQVSLFSVSLVSLKCLSSVSPQDVSRAQLASLPWMAQHYISWLTVPCGQQWSAGTWKQERQEAMVY